MKKFRVGDLIKIRTALKAKRGFERGKVEVHITVHMGTCGIAAGANEVLAALKDEIRKRKLKRVVVTTSGCAGLCSKEPMATVEALGQLPVKYAGLTGGKMVKIVSEHVVKGNAVEDYVLGVGFESTDL